MGGMSDGGQQASPAGGGPVNLSPGVTIVAFDPIIPPLRIPVPAGVDDNPSEGQWLLAFKDDESWRRALQICRGKISDQCEMGARMGCSISAANLCQVPWWKQALVFVKLAKVGKGEQAACEEREMMACLAGSKETCKKYARDTCDPVFAGARIAESHVSLDPRFTGPTRRRMLGKATKLDDGHAFQEANPNALRASRCREDSEPSETDFTKLTTNYRGRILTDLDSIQGSWDGPGWSKRTVEGGTYAETEARTEGWEGGLITPKIDSQRNESGDISAPNVTKKQPMWHAVRQSVESLFKGVRS